MPGTDRWMRGIRNVRRTLWRTIRSLDAMERGSRTLNRSLDFAPHHLGHRLARIDDVEDSAWPIRLEVLDERPRVTSIGRGRIDALCRMVV
jgi:hypothetical protein